MRSPAQDRFKQTLSHSWFVVITRLVDLAFSHLFTLRFLLAVLTHDGHFFSVSRHYALSFFALFLAKIDLPFLRASADDDAPHWRSDNSLRVGLPLLS